MSTEPRQRWKLSEVSITIGQLIGICGTIGGAIMILGILASLRFVDWPTFYQHKTENDKVQSIVEQDRRTVSQIADEVEKWQKRMARKYGEK
jgi:hypothetical protein